MLSVAAAIGTIAFDRALKRARVTADAVWMVAITLAAGFVGAKLWYVFVDAPAKFGAIGWGETWNSTGFSWYGALISGIAALALQGRQAKIGVLSTLYLAAPAVAFGHGIGRIGCFLSGDGCYGIAIRPVHFFSLTFRPWGMGFPNGLQPVFVPVYPTPLYELTVDLFIGWWLWRLLGKPHATGAIAGQYLALAGMARFLVEFIRRNPRVLWGLSVAQFVSAGAVVAGVVLMWCGPHRPLSCVGRHPLGKPA